MTRDDEFIRQLEEYLDDHEGLTPLPDAVREAVSAELPRTRQVGALPWPVRRVNTTIPVPALYGLVAAVIVAAAILGNAYFAGGASENTGADPRPTGSGPLRIAPDTQGDLAAGAYYIDAPFPVRLSFDVPERVGVHSYTEEGSQINLGFGAGEVSFEIVDNISADPCSSAMLDPPVGPAVEDLVTALSNMPGFDTTAATEVGVDGFGGQQFTLVAPDDAEARCGSMLTWETSTRQNGVGPGETNDVTILDVDGVRLLICIAYQPSVPAASLAGLRAIVDSIQIGQ
jgi:hypothetical protein